MTIALLSTGDEIVHGDTLDTNSFNIAHALCSEGLSLGLQLSCSDKDNEISDCIKFLSKSHNIIIIIGGLGPTSDDRTRFVLARLLQRSLIEYPEALDHIQNHLLHSKAAKNANNRQQALFPRNAKLLPNPFGTAMGCYFFWKSKLFVLLPGPPRECLPMFDNYVLPFLQTTEHSKKIMLKWYVFGVAESEISQQFDEALKGIDCQKGYRLETPYVECKVRCESHLMPQVKEKIDPLVMPHIISPGNQKASKRLYEKILQLQTTIAIIDEVTAGTLQNLLQQPATFPWLKFHDKENTNFYFHLRGLKEYWLQEKKTPTTQLTIEYKKNNSQGTETHEIPYRSPLVVQLAAEWICYRLFNLIN